MQGKPVSRAGLLELRNERRVVEDGHRFLDEKRALLAHAVLERLAGFGARLDAFRDDQRGAHGALAGAVAADGLEGLQLRPPAAPMERRLAGRTRSFLGIPMREDAALQADPAAREEASPDDMPPSREAEACAEAFADLVTAALPVATELGNLLRLMHEFQRTQRRVRALEKVVLPELRDDERRMEDALEEVDQEDALRVRLSGGHGGPAQGFTP